jgi:hypothetical protein
MVGECALGSSGWVLALSFSPGRRVASRCASRSGRKPGLAAGLPIAAQLIRSSWPNRLLVASNCAWLLAVAASARRMRAQAAALRRRSAATSGLGSTRFDPREIIETSRSG